MVTDSSQAAQTRPNSRKTFDGVVVSDRAQKTIAVVVQRLEMHRKFKKYIRRRTRFLAHDEKSEAKVGDTVRIAETRPISKLKHWRLVEVLKRAH